MAFSPTMAQLPHWGHSSHSARQRGAALILVLWLMAALSLIVLASAQSVRLQTQRIGVELDRMRAQQVLDAALQLTAQRLVADRGQTQGFNLWQLDFGGDAVQVEIVPSSGLVDVNVASLELLQAVLEKIGGMEPGEAQILAERIQDYIDPDDIPTGAGGAEAAQYRAAGRSVLPRNAPLDDLSELLMVWGMRYEVYGIISPYLGVNGAGRIAIEAAPPALIDLLSGEPGLGELIHASPIEGRAQLLTGVAAEFFQAGGKANASTVRLRTAVRTRQGMAWQRQAWLDLNGRPDSLTPWTILSLEPIRRMETPRQEPQS